MAVFLGELMKIGIAFLVIVYRNASDVNLRDQAGYHDDLEAKTPMLQGRMAGFLSKPSTARQSILILTRSAEAASTGFTWALACPAAFYVIMNNFYLKASKVLEPPVFQTLWQMRLITTAIFSAWILKKAITAKQYGVILLMLTGLACAQNSAASIFQPSGDGNIAVDVLTSLSKQNLALGTTYLAIAGLLSSLATVLLEKIFMDHEKNLWALNIQLGMFSIVPCFLTLLMKAITSSDDFSPLHNLDTFWPWTAIFIHTFAGLLTSFVLRYAGSIARNFAAGLAILLTFLAARFNHRIPTSPKDAAFLFGASLSIFSSYMYYRLAAKKN
jgi:UDP-sugar transporter A1/2/3